MPSNQYQATFSHLEERRGVLQAHFMKKNGSGTYGLGIEALPDQGQGLENGKRYTITRDDWEIIQYHEARDNEYPSQASQEPRTGASAPPPRGKPRVDHSCLTGLAKSLVEAGRVQEPEHLRPWLQGFAKIVRDIDDEIPF